MQSDAERLLELLTVLGRRGSLRDPLWSVVDEVNLTRPQLHAILWLGADGPLPASELARRIDAKGPTLTGVVDRLEALGLVERVRRAEDRRVVEVALTKAGRVLAGRLHEGLVGRLARLLGALPEDDRRALVDIVARLVRSLEEPTGPTPGAGPEQSHEAAAPKPGSNAPQPKTRGREATASKATASKATASKATASKATASKATASKAKAPGRGAKERAPRRRSRAAAKTTPKLRSR